MIGARGEATIVAGDREVPILFTNRALGSAEKQIGQSILGILAGIDSGTTGLNELAILLRVGMDAARVDAREPGPQVSLNAAWDVLDGAGFPVVLERVVTAVAAVLAFGTGEGEAEDPNPL